MTCPFCGKEVKSEDGFCEHCEGYIGNVQGYQRKVVVKQVEKKAPPKKEETKSCGACRQTIPKSSVYCPKCGRLSSVDSSYYGFNTNGTAIAGFILSFLIPILGLIFGIMGRKRADECHNGYGLSLAAIIISSISVAMSILLILGGTCSLCAYML